MGLDMATCIIAEAGVNHNGSLEMALQLVDAAANAGADVVKFQTFNAAKLVSRYAPKAAYQKLTTDASESQLEMISRLELGLDEHEALVAHAGRRGIAFLSTPFDTESLHLLTGKFGLTTIKVSSGDLTNAPFLLEIARACNDVILSTGMATLGEVESALGVLAFGWGVEGLDRPCRAAFERAYASVSGQEVLRQRVTLLHCTTEYPAPFDEVNLRAMGTLARAFCTRIGYSDHTSGIHVPIAAVALGATVIEKHFTLDRGLPGPDHKASLEPAELRSMVVGIRDVERAMGDGIKRPTPSEVKNRDIARKSLVAARSVAVGDPLDLACKRPGNGLSPFDYWSWHGKPAGRDYAADEVLDG
jgi:N-acetylneuraminate synthase